MTESRLSTSTVAAFASLVALVLAADIGGLLYGLSRLDQGVVAAVVQGVAFTLAAVGAGLGAAFAVFAASEHEPLRVTVAR